MFRLTVIIRWYYAHEMVLLYHYNSSVVSLHACSTIYFLYFTICTGILYFSIPVYQYFSFPYSCIFWFVYCHYIYCFYSCRRKEESEEELWEDRDKDRWSSDDTLKWKRLRKRKKTKRVPPNDDLESKHVDANICVTLTAF